MGQIKKGHTQKKKFKKIQPCESSNILLGHATTEVIELLYEEW